MMGLGAWFLLLAFIITVVVMIKVLLGGSSGPESGHHENRHDFPGEHPAYGDMNKEESSHSRTGQEK